MSLIFFVQILFDFLNYLLSFLFQSYFDHLVSLFYFDTYQARTGRGIQGGRRRPQAVRPMGGPLPKWP
jgi:hypothetical protein